MSDMDDCACPECDGCSTLTANGICLDCKQGNHAKDRVENLDEGHPDYHFHGVLPEKGSGPCWDPSCIKGGADHV